MTDENPENNIGVIPATPSEVIKNIQTIYYSIVELNGQLMLSYMNNQKNLQIARNLFTYIVRFVIVTYDYEAIQKNQDLKEVYDFIKELARSRYNKPVEERDVKFNVLFDLVNVCSQAYHVLGIPDIETRLLTQNG